MGDYVIIGDTKDYKDCLVYVCGTLKCATETLHQMLNNPDDNDKRIMQDHSNFRIIEVPEKDCWWRGNCD